MRVLGLAGMLISLSIFGSDEQGKSDFVEITGKTASKIFNHLGVSDSGMGKTYSNAGVVNCMISNQSKKVTCTVTKMPNAEDELPENDK